MNSTLLCPGFPGQCIASHLLKIVSHRATDCSN
jgi:hypothetical protein